MSTLLKTGIMAALVGLSPFATETQLPEGGQKVNPTTGLEVKSVEAIEPAPAGQTVNNSQTVKRHQKASNLIGMEVRNASNEKLGEIKDVVLDLPTGRISYAVLAVGGFLGIGEKLVAVPSSAFGFAADETYLILEADKAKVAGAVSFPATSWPGPNEPVNETYWLTPTAASGAPARNESAGASRLDVRTDLKTAPSAKESGSKIYAEPPRREFADINPGGADTGSTSIQNQSFVGTVRTVDIDSQHLVIQTVDGESRRVRIDDQTEILLGQGAAVKMESLKPGFPVRVEFEKQGEELVARHIVKGD